MAAEDIVAISVIVLVLALGLFTAAYVGDTVSTTMTGMAQINSSSAANSVFSSISTLTSRFDYLILVSFLGLILSVIILSWFVPAHPIFYLAYFIVLILSVVISTVMSHLWDVFSTHAAITSELIKFPITNHLLSNMPIYITVIGFIGITVMFAKPYISEGAA